MIFGGGIQAKSFLFSNCKERCCTFDLDHVGAIHVKILTQSIKRLAFHGHILSGITQN